MKSSEPHLFTFPEGISPEDRASFIARSREQALASYRPPPTSEWIFGPVLALGFCVPFLLVVYMSRGMLDAVVASHEDDSGIADSDRAAVS